MIVNPSCQEVSPALQARWLDAIVTIIVFPRITCQYHIVSYNYLWHMSPNITTVHITCSVVYKHMKAIEAIKFKAYLSCDIYR